MKTNFLLFWLWAFSFGFAPLKALEADAPVSLVITYRAKPERRVAFRTWLGTKGREQFAHWRNEEVFAGARILFTSFAASNTVDALVILDFRHYTDSARWKEVEKKFPGGLTAEALSLAAPESASYADVIGRDTTEGRDATKVTYLIAFYELLTDLPRYTKYFEGYTVPQLRGWMKSGALSGYAMYLNQAPLGKPWDDILLLEYTSIAGLARRDEIKADVRAQLAASDPIWLEWSKDKGSIRRELSLVIADLITP